MAINLGQLFVKLGVDFSEWAQGLDKQAYNVGQFARKVEREFKSIANSVSFVSGTLGLFGTQGLAISQTLLMMGRAAASTTKAISGMSGPLAVIAGPLAGIGIGALSAAAGFTALGIASINAAARTQQLAMATGLHASTLAALTPLAKAYGVDQDYLARAMERMEKNALAAAKSGHLMSNGFTDLGINARQFVQLPIEQKLVILSSKFQTLGHEGHKTAIAIEIFGRAGAAMVPVLEMGPKKMQAWIDYAKRVGAVMNDEAYAGALKLKEETARLGLVWEGVTNQLVIGFLPALNGIVTAFAAGTEKGNSFELIARTIGKTMIVMAETILRSGYALEWWIDKIGGADLAVQKWQATTKTGKVVENVTKNLTFLATGGLLGEFVSPTANLPGGDKNKVALSYFAGVEEERRKQRVKKDFSIEEQLKALNAPLTDAFGLPKEGGGGKPVVSPEFTKAMERMKSELERLATAAQKARAEGLSLGEAFGPKVWAEATAATAAFIANLKSQFGNVPGMNAVIDKLDKSKIFSAELAAKLQAASKMVVGNAEKEVRAIQEQTAALHAKNEADRIGGALAKAAVGTPARVAAIQLGFGDARSALAKAREGEDPAALKQAQSFTMRMMLEVQKASKESGKLSREQVVEFVEGEIRKVSALQRTQEAIENIQDLLGKGPKAGLGPEAQAELDKQRAALTDLQKAALTQQEALHRVTERGQKFDLDATHAAAALKLADFHEDMRQKDIGFAEDNAAAIQLQTLYKRGIETKRKQFELNNQALFQKDEERNAERELIKLWDEKALRAGTFGQKARAVFNDLKLEGDKLGEVIAGAFKTGIEQWETSLAHFIVTGQGSMKQVFVQFEETIVKGVIAKGIGKIAGTIAPHLPGPLKTIAEKIGLGKRDGSDAAHALFVTMTSGIPGVGGGSINDVLKNIPLIGSKESPVGQAASGAGSLISGLAKKAAGAAGGTGAQAGVTAGLNKQATAASKAGMAGIWASLSWIPIVGPALATGFGAIMLGEMAAATALGMLATGGDVTPGRAYIVGERGPEIFRSGTGGHVFPNSKLREMGAGRGSGGGDTHFTFAPVVQSFDANGVDAVLAEHGAKFVEHMDSHVRRSNWRGQPSD